MGSVLLPLVPFQAFPHSVLQPLPKRSVLEKSSWAGSLLSPSLLHYQQALASSQALQQPTAAFYPTGELPNLLWLHGWARFPCLSQCLLPSDSVRKYHIMYYCYLTEEICRITSTPCEQVCYIKAFKKGVTLNPYTNKFLTCHCKILGFIIAIIKLC